MSNVVCGKIAIDGTAALSYVLRKPGVECSSEASPAMVVFISGLLTSMADWDPVASEIPSGEQHLWMLSYDRWGCGQSDPLPSARTVNDISTCANDLATLVQNVSSRHHLPAAEMHLLLVGSSIGCSIIRLFVERFSRASSIGEDMGYAVSGVLMLDPYISNTDFTSLFPPAAPDEPEPLTRTRSVISRLFHPSVKNKEGLDRSTAARLLPSATEPKFPGDPELVVVAHDPEHTAKDMEEKVGLDGYCYLKYVDSAWQQHNEGLATLSRRGSLLRAERSGHFIYRDRPDLVVQQISSLYERIC